MKLITDHTHFIVIVFIYSVWKFSDMYLKYMTNFTIELSKNFTDIKKCTWLVWLTLFFPTVVVLVLHGCLEVMVLLLLLMPMGTCMCMKRQALSSYISPCCKFWFEHVFTLFFSFFFFPRAKMVQMILHFLLSRIQCSFLLRMHVTVRCWNWLLFCYQVVLVVLHIWIFPFYYLFLCLNWFFFFFLRQWALAQITPPPVVIVGCTIPPNAYDACVIYQ